MKKGPIETFVLALIMFVIQIFFVKFFWNTSLVKHVTVLKRTETWGETALLAIALSFMGMNIDVERALMY